jgi:hypothetical protein
MDRARTHLNPFLPAIALHIVGRLSYAVHRASRWGSMQQPSTSRSDCAANQQQRTFADLRGRPDNHPTRTDRLPATTDRLPATTDRLTARTDRLTARTDSLPARTDRLPTRTDSLTATTDRLLARTDSLPARTDRLLTSTDSLPATTDSLPATTDSLPATTDSLPTSTDRLPATTDSLPTMTDSLPATTDRRFNRVVGSVGAIVGMQTPPPARATDPPISTGIAGKEPTMSPRSHQATKTRTFGVLVAWLYSYSVRATLMRRKTEDERRTPTIPAFVLGPSSLVRRPSSVVRRLLGAIARTEY